MPVPLVQAVYPAVTVIGAPLVEMLASPLAYAATSVDCQWKVGLSAVVDDASSIGILKLCTEPFASVQFSVKVTPPVPGVAQAVPV